MQPENDSTRLEAILAKLQNVTKSGKGYKALCPAHDDKEPSLSIGIGYNGKVLLNCLAGCSYKQISESLQLDSSDYRSETTKRIIATYPYCDEQGALLYEKVRYEPKDFRIRRPDGAGWSWNRGNSRAVLYRLPDLKKAITEGADIFIVEGEKDADRLHLVGLTATANIEGASKQGQHSKWRSEYTDQLAGAKRIIIIPDNDDPGRAHAEAIAKTLIGRVEAIRVLALPVPNKGDVSDWFNAGHTVAELLALVEKIPAPRLKLLTVDDVLTRSMAHDWLIKGYIERKQTVVLYGESQSYKSLLAIEMACAIAKSIEWRNHQTKPGAVLYIVGEGGGGGLTRRLRAWEIANHTALAGAPLFFREIPTLLPIDTHDLIENVTEFLTAHGWKLELVILDTLARTLQGDENSQQDFAKYQQALDTLRDTFDCAAMFCHHTGHLEKDRPRGAYSIMGNADVLLQMEKLDEKLSKLVARKLKDAATPEDIIFQLAVVELGGLDEDGNPVTSVVLRHLRDFQAPPSPLTGYEKIAYDILAEHDVMLIGEWRKTFFDAVKSTKPDMVYNTLKQAWSRVHSALLRKSLVFEVENRAGTRPFSSDTPDSPFKSSSNEKGTSGTLRVQVPFVPGLEKGTSGTSPLRDVPDVPNPCTHSENTYTDFVFYVQPGKQIAYHADPPITLAMATLAGRKQHRTAFQFAEVKP